MMHDSARHGRSGETGGRTVGADPGGTKTAAGWWRAAYCRGADTDTFFPLPGDQAAIQRALQICESCPVRIPCRRYALGRRERYGIWGGLTEETRERIMRGGPAVGLEPATSLDLR